MIKEALQAERDFKRLNRYDNNDDTLSILSGAPTLSLQGTKVIASRQAGVGGAVKQSKTIEKVGMKPSDRISLASVESLSKNNDGIL